MRRYFRENTQKPENEDNVVKVEVSGTFQKVKYVGRHRFYDEVEAKTINKLRKI